METNISNENEAENLKPVNHLQLPSLTEWEFGTVKDILTNSTERNVEIFSNYVKDLTQQAQIEQWLWFKTEIDTIIDMENMLVSVVARPSIDHLVHQIDFSGFDYFPQIWTLTGGDITKYDKVMKQKYITCYIFLLYGMKTSDLEYLVSREHSRRNNTL